MSVPHDESPRADANPPSDAGATNYGREPAVPTDPAATQYRPQAGPPADGVATHYTPIDPDATRYGASDPAAGRPRGFRPCVFGEYDLLERFEPGGMGIVYKARQRSTGRLVALKRIRSDKHNSDATLARFQREARAAAGLDHPAIVPVYEIGEAEGECYFTMAYLPGGNLEAVRKEGPLPATTAAWLVRQVAEAVQHAHDHGVLHRDVKPANVLLQGGEASAAGEALVAGIGLASADPGRQDGRAAGASAGRFRTGLHRGGGGPHGHRRRAGYAQLHGPRTGQG